MKDQEIFCLFEWACDELKSFEYKDCNGGIHFYFNDVFVGGCCGESFKYFIVENRTFNKIKDMYYIANS